jgi:hypothetical protein
MVARRRRDDEEFGDYREALKHQAKVDRVKLKGKWVWRSHMQNPENPNQLIKIPPYRKPKDEPSTEDEAV